MSRQPLGPSSPRRFILPSRNNSGNDRQRSPLFPILASGVLAAVIASSCNILVNWNSLSFQRRALFTEAQFQFYRDKADVLSSLRQELASNQSNAQLNYLAMLEDVRPVPDEASAWMRDELCKQQARAALYFANRHYFTPDARRILDERAFAALQWSLTDEQRGGSEQFNQATSMVLLSMAASDYPRMIAFERSFLAAIVMEMQNAADILAGFQYNGSADDLITACEAATMHIPEIWRVDSAMLVDAPREAGIRNDSDALTK